MSFNLNTKINNLQTQVNTLQTIVNNIGSNITLPSNFSSFTTPINITNIYVPILLCPITVTTPSNLIISTMIQGTDNTTISANVQYIIEISINGGTFTAINVITSTITLPQPSGQIFQLTSNTATNTPSGSHVIRISASTNVAITLPDTVNIDAGTITVVRVS
jgi:hypothetical protein